MADEKLKRWIEQKLEEGVSRERVKESLENTGHDPSLVDEVQDPFEDADQDEDPFQGEGSGGEDGVDLDSDGSEEEAEAEEDGSSEDDGSGGEAAGGFTAPDTGIGVPDLPYRYIGAAFLVLVLAGGGVFAWQQGVFQGVSGALDGGGDAREDVLCPDVGVIIRSASVQGGETVAEVEVTRGRAEVILEVFRGGELQGSSKTVLEGRATMSVPATGDRIVFRPTGCTEFRDSYSFS